MNVRVEVEHIDKTGFLIRRSVFPGFPDKEHGITSDGQMVALAVQLGATVAKVREVLSVHN